mgnify:CR=1 FL=1
MTFASMNMTENLKKLRSSMGTITPEQQTIFKELQAQIDEQGRYYDVCSITMEDMLEHGYEVSEENCFQIEKIAEKVELDAEEQLWNGVDTWAEIFGIIRREEE